VGPSLDGTALTRAEIAGVVANGRGTGMPAFSGRLSEEEIENVAVYGAAASSRSP
jgi:mono/diheme cytochrome c family protein